MDRRKSSRQKRKTIVRNNFYLFGKAMSAEPGLVVLSALMRVVVSVRTSFLRVIFLAYIISCMEQKKTLAFILTFIGISFLIVGVTYAVQSFFENRYQPVCQEKLVQSLQRELFEKMRTVDLQSYDTESYYSAITLAGEECSKRAVQVVGNFLNLLESVLTLALTCVSVIGADWIVPVVAAVSFGFSFWMNQKMVSRRVSYDTAVKLKEKEASMLKRVLYLPEYAKDIRSSGMKQTVLERYRKNTEEKAVLIRKQGGKIGRLTALETIGGSCLLIDFFASLYLAVKTLVWNTMTASGFVAVLNACNQIQFSLESLSAQIAVFAENGTLIERFRTVENMEPEIEKKEPGQSAAPFETLQVQDICFQYENNKFGLKNVRFEIKKGEKVAFVGENGSGKTTLVKLLLRLYDCSSGEILYNGMPVEKMNTRTYRSAYSTLFQDFNLYAASVAENVSMNQNPDLEKVREALICARIPKAADQLDGIISKEFCADGIDFSGGERQRIALARVFYENHDILIMDEPTAAMDIRFEKEFYDLVFSYLKDKTILMISHRLASITACDRIFYMENGSITEQGTHQELMEKQGKYAKLFLAQLN